MGIYGNIQRLCKEKGVNIAILERDLSLSRGSLYKWDEHPPGIEKVKKVADYLGKTIDEIVGREV